MRHSAQLALLLGSLLPIACQQATADLDREADIGQGLDLMREKPEPLPTVEPSDGDVSEATARTDGTSPSDGDIDGESGTAKKIGEFTEGLDDAATQAILALEVVGTESARGEDGEYIKNEDGALMVTFSDLSLVGYDVDKLLDPDDDSQTMPEHITMLDGQRCAVEGYMLPMEWKKKKVVSFMLVRDMAGCCFGGMPMPDEWVEVVMEEGKGCDYYPYIPVLVTGKFGVGGETDELGYVTGAYTLIGETVTDEW